MDIVGDQRFTPQSRPRQSSAIIIHNRSQRASDDPFELVERARKTPPGLSAAVVIYKATGNRRADQILLGHATIESTVRYLGVDVDDALELSERRKSEWADDP